MRYVLVLTVLGLITAYQNCSQSMKPNGDAANVKEERIGSSSQYTKIVYDPYLEAMFRPGTDLGLPKRLELDIENGTLKVTNHSNSTVRQCTIDAARLQAIRDLLASADICKPGPLPDNTPVCMAIGIADIELSKLGASIQLRPVICHSGIFLCDGLDVTFRSLLADLRDNAPVDCK